VTADDKRRTLIREVKQLIVDALQLDDVKPDDISDTDPLFGGGLALDSIDALELAIAVTRAYGVKMAQNEETRAAFRSVGHLADFILLHRT
jgi:acyl carrier protein